MGQATVEEELPPILPAASSYRVEKQPDHRLDAIKLKKEASFVVHKRKQNLSI